MAHSIQLAALGPPSEGPAGLESLGSRDKPGQVYVVRPACRSDLHEIWIEIRLGRRMLALQELRLPRTLWLPTG